MCSTKVIIRIVRSHFSVGRKGMTFIIVVSNEGVTKLLQGLNPSKAFGPDELHPRVLKKLATELGPVFAHLFQQSVKIPPKWSLTLLKMYVPSIKRKTGLSHVIIVPSRGGCRNFEKGGGGCTKFSGPKLRYSGFDPILNLL